MSVPPRYRPLLRTLTLFFTLLFSAVGHARPDMTPLGPNIADKGSAFYHFTVNTFASADGKRRYRTWTAVPDKAPPAAGYPVIYMLDGNAVMDRLGDGLLAALAADNPPVIIAVGYQTDLPFELYARAWDDTPPVAGSANRSIRGRQGGGAPAFRRLLEETIGPQAEKGIAIDAARRGIWGHSLGGIFVLDAYYHSTFFSRFYATSPTLNRDYIGLLTRLTAADSRRFSARRLQVVEGGWPATKNPQAPAPETLDLVRETLAELSGKGFSAGFTQYPRLSHGETFSVGLEAALRDMATRP
ncbi:alpha/beta hydrolase [Pluralibacter gergoviae]|uniref:alpha/beta hydrolase n=1 Tax=Pluralibacter gergoviae TaxID=61647 RepID=UPI0005ECA28A|nr:alpha/beta hydrolase-fold protein [Pluralibacter gergoviae]KJM65995.1 hypothetical protein SS31_03850 [Pluralibacter gergoviae]